MFWRSHSFNSSFVVRSGMRSSCSSGDSGVLPSPVVNEGHRDPRFLRGGASPLSTASSILPTAWFSSAIECSTPRTRFFASARARFSINSCMLLSARNEGIDQVAIERIGCRAQALQGDAIFRFPLLQLQGKLAARPQPPCQFT